MNSRYFDEYESTNTSAKRGDASGDATTANPGCAGWHDASYVDWVSKSMPYSARSFGGIFTIGRFDSINDYFYCRGVAVCGLGL